jgi:hypothetical protein
MGRFRYIVFLCVLLLLTSCFRQAPPPVTTPNEETPVVTDAQIDNAGNDEGQATTLEGTTDDSNDVNADASLDAQPDASTELSP